MTGNRQGLCKKVGHVVEAADEEDTEVSLADPVSYPVQAHVRGKRFVQWCCSGYSVASYYRHHHRTRASALVTPAPQHCSLSECYSSYKL